MLLVSILFKKVLVRYGHLLCILSTWHRDAKGTKETRVVLNTVFVQNCLVDLHFSRKAPYALSPVFSSPTSLIVQVPNHCSVSLPAGAKACGCVSLRLRLLSDLRQLAKEILFQTLSPEQKAASSSSLPPAR